MSTLHSSLEHTVSCLVCYWTFTGNGSNNCCSSASDSSLLFTDSRAHQLTFSLAYSSSIVVFVSVAAGTCLPSRCPETGLVYPPISPSLRCSSSTHYNMKVLCSIKMHRDELPGTFCSSHWPRGLRHGCVLATGWSPYQDVLPAVCKIHSSRLMTNSTEPSP
jgi:hypothetical protein